LPFASPLFSTGWPPNVPSKTIRLAVVASHPVQYQAPLFRELARRVELTVYYAHNSSPRDQADAGFGVPFEWDTDLLSGYDHMFLNNVATRPALSRFSGCDTPAVAAELARLKPDAVLVPGWHLKSFLQAVWAAKRAGIPVMVRGDSHLDTPRSLGKRAAKALVYPIALRVFDAALYVGERSRLYWERYGYPKHRLFFSPHCIDNAWFAERATPAAGLGLRELHGIPPDAKVVLFAGKLVDLKRPHDLVEAAALLPATSRPVLLFAGSGALEQSVRVVAAVKGVRVVPLGFVNQSQMPAAYAACDVLALPSAHETWGLVTNEALACGRPVILSDQVGSAPDLAGDRSAGRIFPVGEVEALASALAEVFDTPPQQEAIAAKSNAYGIDAAANGVIQAAEFVVRQPSSS
jgi:glycosyltransferase involved in cell wall biosynthesis